ncbi:4Fe-4S binding protein [Desulfotomaculum sp. 1211_IL3151]|uniref:4Fe-4S binding protein n=1 Tax=Desulfotomaculum sp. 1211_IL3151 TaxID=3084055 RepID=UPI002FD89582
MQHKENNRGQADTNMYQITRCRNCHRAIIDLDRMESVFKEFFEQTDFTNKQLARLGSTRAMPHHIFRVAIAGCPNSCSQPQIKDFALQGQAVPVVGEGCTDCGRCVAACPDQAISLAEQGPHIDRSLCLNCGKCAQSCPTGAIATGNIGYRVLRGGKLGRRPQLAQEVCSLTDEQGVLQWLQQTIDLLHREGQPGERLGTLLARIEKNDEKHST